MPESPIPRGPLVDPNEAPDRQSGAQINRFSGRKAAPWRVARSRVSAAETVVAATVLNAAIVSDHNRVQWLVLVPPGVTGYTVTVGRWLYQLTPIERTQGFTFDRFVQDESVVVGSGIDTLLYQRPERDPIVVLITAITGVPTGPPPGVAKPNNPNYPVASDDDGFVVLWRPADPE